MGRDVLAEQVRALALQVINGEWPLAVLQKHPSYPVFQPLLGGASSAGA